MKILSWNVRHQGFEARRERVISAIQDELPDIVLLQEVPSASIADMEARLAGIGLAHAVDSETDAPPRPAEFTAKKLRKGYVTLVASKWPIERADDAWRANAPYPEAMVRAKVRGPEDVEIDLFNVHIPNGGGNGWRKVDTLDALYRALIRAPDEPRILCGDFNEPEVFRRSGQIVPFHSRIQADGGLSECESGFKDDFGTTRPEREWPRAVLRVLGGVAHHGLVDVVRAKHGFDHAPTTHETAKKNPRCFDHGFASRHFEIDDVRYRHDWREAKLSDHSALVFDVTTREQVGPLTSWEAAESGEEMIVGDE
jgi:endonuclease/exonuclease/phosphatase family metal-dependent hydrolase